jgi:general secretion pathway protein D
MLRPNRLPAAEARVLRPLIAESGYIAIEDPNAIIINDTSANVARIMAIASQF